MSTAPGEWRTRGRASYDLALVEAKKGRKDAAKAALRASMQTGYRIKDLDPSLAALVQEVERADVVRDAGAAVPRPSFLPREASLFPVDAYGEPDVKAKKPPAPEGLILFHF